MSSPGPPPTAWQQNGFTPAKVIGTIPARSPRRKEPSADLDTAAEAWKHVSRIAGSTHRHDLYDLLQNAPSDSQYSVPQAGVSTFRSEFQSPLQLLLPCQALRVHGRDHRQLQIGACGCRIVHPGNGGTFQSWAKCMFLSQSLAAQKYTYWFFGQHQDPRANHLCYNAQSACIICSALWSTYLPCHCNNTWKENLREESTCILPNAMTIIHSGQAITYATG